jgi:hypothetical protein
MKPDRQLLREMNYGAPGATHRDSRCSTIGPVVLELASQAGSLVIKEPAAWLRFQQPAASSVTRGGHHSKEVTTGAALFMSANSHRKSYPES